MRVSPLTYCWGLLIPAFLLVYIAGCTISCTTSVEKVEHQTIEQQTLASQNVKKLSVKSHNGWIKETHHDAKSVELTATIIGRAMTTARAEQLAEETEIITEYQGDQLFIKSQKPKTKSNESVGVSFDIKVPADIPLSLTSHNGRIEATDMNNALVAVTHNGRIVIKEVSGTLDLTTHNGSIKCEKVSSNVGALTHNGSINVTMNSEIFEPVDCKLVTHNGSVTLRTVENYCASAFLKTRNGKIYTEKQITISGKLGREYAGTLGQGEPDSELHVETYNGSIKIY